MRELRIGIVEIEVCLGLVFHRQFYERLVEQSMHPSETQRKRCLVLLQRPLYVNPAGQHPDAHHAVGLF